MSRPGRTADMHGVEGGEMSNGAFALLITMDEAIEHDISPCQVCLVGWRDYDTEGLTGSCETDCIYFKRYQCKPADTPAQEK